ncbi:alpha/beta fold hydrolase [Sphingosinicella sp. BN140058]|uniref:alpha/beta fold hydrolase n=1 Tax=Sphingosinicella sp. BN140058 TaxID=1892855 RepID=UPI001012D674|nr:alpha/beta hydrolase [Sphingosinicella sp. BN140058]QAY78273.1 alpha/beta hydrolase [Sphingosinicella sp. BN140058]
MTSQMVEVEKNVSLEVLEWSGSGRPMVFLAGFGGTAQDFDGFAEKFTADHRVVSITRRGFGVSSHPLPIEQNYTPERLALDVMTVIRRLELKRPIIVGHSIAGQELSEIGTRYPQEIGGLIYLEAAEPQAFYGPHSRAVYPIAAEVRRDLALLGTAQPSDGRTLVAKLRRDLLRLSDGLDWYEKALEGAPDRPATSQSSPQLALQAAVMNGFRLYSQIDVPILSVVAVPPRCDDDCDSERYRRRSAEVAAQADDVARANPNAQVVRLPNAGHFIWETNPQQVEQAVKAFIARVFDHQ